MSPTAILSARQLWAQPTSTVVSYCTPFTLPSAGLLILNDSLNFTLTQNAVFQPDCNGVVSDNSTVIDHRAPFYTSTLPQIFAIATATVVSYLLVLILFITPRTFFVGGLSGGSGFLSRRGMISGSYGSSSVVGVGRRPWLQKIAALTVAISLTIATADTFKVAERQYAVGIMDSDSMVAEVAAGLEIRVVRVISDTFLWLAQVQTLIRLFPRHKEKVTIKWLGFALIILDTVFSILNNFINQGEKLRPRTFRDAIPALSYLFELAIGLIYASCIIYYSLSKRRFAFYNPKMRNICLVALLSLTAVLIPVVFFVLDVSKPDVAGWGNYIRWVGAAAASVVVWEWVERIEALERDERKDGILGREVFDGDEMLEVTPSEEVDWPGRRHYRQNGDPGGGGSASGRTPGPAIFHRPITSRVPFHTRHGKSSTEGGSGPSAIPTKALPAAPEAESPVLPTPAVTPINRAENTSAGSTVYVVRYHTIASPSPPIVEAVPYEEPELPKEVSMPSTTDVGVSEASNTHRVPQDTTSVVDATQRMTDTHVKAPASSRWLTPSNPFKRRRALPPAEVAGAQRLDGSTRRSPVIMVAGNWDILSRVNAFASAQREKIKARANGQTVEMPMTVTVIPAQKRGQRTWSPDEIHGSVDEEAYSREEESEQSQIDERNRQRPRSRSSGSDPPVTIISAPSRGPQTWSPQPSGKAAPLRPEENPVSSEPAAHPTPSENIHSGSTFNNQSHSRHVTPSLMEISSNDQPYSSGTVISRRGAITISENGSKAHPYRELHGPHDESSLLLPHL